MARTPKIEDTLDTVPVEEVPAETAEVAVEAEPVIEPEGVALIVDAPEVVNPNIVAQGAAARAEGVPVEACPYGKGDMADLWLTGYAAG